MKDTDRVFERLQVYLDIYDDRSELDSSPPAATKRADKLPICTSCKKIRNGKGYWNQIEAYITEHSEVKFGYMICPECTKKLCPEFINPEERGYQVIQLAMG